jgi:hypothetical protein
MKKLVLFVVVALVAGVLCSCNSCKSKEKKEKKEVAEAEITLERTIALDKEYMFANYGGDYRWFESCILLKDYLDEENDGTIAGISNVFQVVREDIIEVKSLKEKSADVFVVLAAHTPDTTAYEVKEGFWVEDCDMANEEIKLTYKDAYNKIMAVNLPKPHSKNCVLRKPIGPLTCNAQYVFGNIQAQLWVDAVTGEVKESNPAFPEK